MPTNLVLHGLQFGPSSPSPPHACPSFDRANTTQQPAAASLISFLCSIRRLHGASLAVVRTAARLPSTAHHPCSIRSPPWRTTPAPSALLHGEPPLLCLLLFHGVRCSGKIKLRRGEIEQYGHHEVSIDGITPPTTHFVILISSLLLLPSPSMGSATWL